MANTDGKLDRSLMKKANRQLIFSIINREKTVSRVQIAKLSSMSAMSVGRIVDELVKLGIVVERDGDDMQTGAGRKPKLLSVACDSFLSVGAEIGRDGVNVGIIDFRGQVVRQIRHSRDLSALPADEVLKTTGGMVCRILEENRDLPVIPAVGIVCPGLIDGGTVRFSSQLKWRNVEAAEELRRLTGIENIAIDNEVKARAVAEDLFGVGKQFKRSVVLNIGSGIGSALMINHELYRGRLNMAGEIGHICISPAGNLCECGRRGCLQTYIADWAILREARAVREDITLEGVFGAYSAGETWAINLIHRVMEYISVTVSMLANAYAPDVVILCGSLIENYGFFKNLIMKNYKSEISDYVLDSFQLCVSDFGPEGTLVGAGTLAFYNFLDRII